MMTMRSNACSQSDDGKSLAHLYLRRILKSVCAVFLSSVFVKRFSAGGTFSRWFSTRRCRWMRTYFGHFTNRCRSRFGAGAAPTPARQKYAPQLSPVQWPTDLLAEEAHWTGALVMVPDCVFERKASTV